MDELCLKKAREKALLQKAYLQSILVSKIKLLEVTYFACILDKMLSLMIERRRLCIS